MKNISWLILLLAFCFVSCFSEKLIIRKKDLSPYDFGLASAKTAVERYNILLEVHKAANKAGVNVDYSGIDTVKIEIPKNSPSIPLTRYNDFKGCVFQVKNMAKPCGLFICESEGYPIQVEKWMIDSGDFHSIDSLNQGRFLLIIEDKNPWVLKRRGFSYGHQRKDILLIENGLSANSCIMPYNNSYSSPKCNLIKLRKEPLVIKNITIEREYGCTCLTNIAYITGCDNIQISDINIYTQPSSLVNDHGITINNCTNVTLENVQIDGTYSQVDQYGYGISLNNVWNFKAKKLFGKGNWGIFGNNNVNTAFILDSEINRFDVHCYGRDIRFKKVKFFDLYNQFSSMYGCVRFDNCEFRDFVPVLIETSYNAYTEFNVDINDCVFYITTKKYYLIDTGSMNGEINTRQELLEKRIPKVNITKLRVISLDTGEEKKQVELFLQRGSFIQERNIKNIIEL